MMSGNRKGAEKAEDAEENGTAAEATDNGHGLEPQMNADEHR